MSMDPPLVGMSRPMLKALIAYLDKPVPNMLSKMGRHRSYSLFASILTENDNLEPVRTHRSTTDLARSCLTSSYNKIRAIC
jgi:hypothetical protein